MGCIRDLIYQSQRKRKPARMKRQGLGSMQNVTVQRGVVGQYSWARDGEHARRLFGVAGAFEPPSGRAIIDLEEVAHSGKFESCRSRGKDHSRTSWAGNQQQYYRERTGIASKTER
jgi:hypothetical protein